MSLLLNQFQKLQQLAFNPPSNYNISNSLNSIAKAINGQKGLNTDSNFFQSKVLKSLESISQALSHQQNTDSSLSEVPANFHGSANDVRLAGLALDEVERE